MCFCLFFNPNSFVFNPVFFEVLFNVFLLLFLYPMLLVFFVRILKFISVFLPFLVFLRILFSHNPIRPVLFPLRLRVFVIFNIFPNFSKFCYIKNVKILFLDFQNSINLCEFEFREFFYRNKSAYFEAELLVYDSAPF